MRLLTTGCFIALLAMLTPEGFGTTSVLGSEPVPEWYQESLRVRAKLEEWPRANQAVAGEVAASVARWSSEVGVNPELVLAVMRVENPWLKPDTVSYAGAVGLMQVMPRYWSDAFENCGGDLTDIDVNVCKGIHILGYYLSRSADFRSAMLAYNGCRSTRCQDYTDHVVGYLD